MNQQAFAYLPSEIFTEVILRLPLKTILICKCVCKSWLALLESSDFVKFHLSKAVPDVAVYWASSKFFKTYEFEEKKTRIYNKPTTKFYLPCHGWIRGSSSGLLFVCLPDPISLPPYICNPTTRDYIELHCPQDIGWTVISSVAFGFGTSKINGQHKVVWIFASALKRQPFLSCECRVYTVGTGLWRRIAPLENLMFGRYNTGALLNGNLHWLVKDIKTQEILISCFDLESEKFSTFSCPPGLGDESFDVGLHALGGCLCLCDGESGEGQFVIWTMREYGVEKSWTKQLIICKDPPIKFVSFSKTGVYPIKVYKDGDILIAWQHHMLFRYSLKKGQIVDMTAVFEPGTDVIAFCHTPSFLSLKSFEMEKVSSF